MRKKDDSPAISLFSFQDIITSITGIMFLVVLLLVLLIFESRSKEQKAPEDQAAPELTAQIRVLENEIAAMRKQDQQLKQQLEQYRKMPAEKIEQKMNELKKKLAQHQEAYKKLKRDEIREKNKEQQLAVQEQDLKKQQENLAKELKMCQAKVSKSQKKLEEVKRQVEIAKQTVKFTVEQKSDRNALLAEFSTNGFRVLDMATQKTYDLRKENAHLQEQILALKTWLESRNRHTETLSVILGPSKLKYWHEVNRMLQQIRFIHGLELYPSDDVSIFAGGVK